MLHDPLGQLDFNVGDAGADNVESIDGRIEVSCGRRHRQLLLALLFTLPER
jgi:hypothetical protein